MVNVFNELIVSEEFSENMTPEASLTVLKTFKGFVYSFTELNACDHEYTNPSKVFNFIEK